MIKSEYYSYNQSVLGYGKTLVISHATVAEHDDVIKWKHFPRYEPFMRRSHRSPLQRPVTRSFDVIFDSRLNKLFAQVQLTIRSQRWFSCTLEVSMT